jgi:hypothetical protein
MQRRNALVSPEIIWHAGWRRVIRGIQALVLAGSPGPVAKPLSDSPMTAMFLYNNNPTAGD